MSQRYDDDFWRHLDQLVRESEVMIDRPKDSAHPDYEDSIYPVDYGYLAGTTSSDGAGIDVWRGGLGSHQVVGIVCTVDLVKRDAEIKILLGCDEDEMRQITEFLNAGEGMCCQLIIRGK